jgi:HD-like signal output (HDOD) protein
MIEVAPATTRILFVDDEPAILSGLRSLLHRQRKDWEMVFALGSEQAIEQLEAQPFQIVVTDMRMPKLDGAQLLHLVQERWPSTCRIVLSGHAEREAMLRVVPAMHVFLAKPCDSKTLRGAISRCLEVHARTDNPVLRTLIGRVDKLPSPPHLHAALTKLAKDPRTSLDELGSAIATDTAFATKVMQLANSTAFGEVETTSLPRAVRCLGLELLRSLALSPTIYAPASGPALPWSLGRMQDLALRSAVLARRYVRTPALAEVAFVTALVRDVGRIVLALGLPDGYAATLAECAASGESVCDAERRNFGADHAQIGGRLLQMWGLPQLIVDAVAAHHEPRGCTGDLAEVVAAVHVADAMSSEDHPSPIDLEFLHESGFASDLERWRELASSQP